MIPFKEWLKTPKKTPLFCKVMAVPRTKNIDTICKEIHDSSSKEKLLVQALLGLSQLECRKMRETYMKMYGEDLIQLCLRSHEGLSSSLLTLMILDPFERDADVAREALHSYIDYKVLVELYTCRKSSHVLLIQHAYHAKYRSHLDLDIAILEPPHPYQKILMALSASHKAHHDEVSQHIAKCDAKRLYETGEGRRGGVDESVVLEMFSKRSIAQLKITFSSYISIYGHNYTSFLKNEEFGEIEDAVRFVAKCICNPPRYYAKVIKECLKGRRREIMRIMVSRGEVDLDEIEKELKKKYGVELRNVICESFPLGDDRDFLVELATKYSTCLLAK